MKYEIKKIFAKNNSVCSIIMKQSRVSEAMTRSEIDWGQRSIIPLQLLFICQTSRDQKKFTTVNLNPIRETGTVIDLLSERIAGNSVCRSEDHIHALLRLWYRMISRRVCSMGLCSHAGGTFCPSHWF